MLIALLEMLPLLPSAFDELNFFLICRPPCFWFALEFLAMSGRFKFVSVEADDNYPLVRELRETFEVALLSCSLEGL